MVPYPPAGGADTTARILYAKLGEMLGQQFVIENRGGAGGTIGEAVVAKADPMATPSCTTHRFSVNSRSIRICRSTTTRISIRSPLVSLVPNILVVTPSVPVKTSPTSSPMPKPHPMASTWRPSGNGTLSICRWRCSASWTGIKINHVPYRGGGLALNDVMAGQVKFFFSNGSSVVGLIQGGKVKAIAHTGKGRLKSLPDIPPVSDTLPGFEAYEWNGVFVPHGTPAAIVQALNSAVNAALRDPKSQPLRTTQYR